MQHLPHPRSPLFRVATLLALFAWTALAFGSPLPVAAPPDCVAGTAMPMVMDGAHAHAQTPDGHGVCCHPGCHCLAPFGVDRVAPSTLVSAAPATRSRFQSTAPARVPVMSAPPLRPPIA